MGRRRHRGLRKPLSPAGDFTEREIIAAQEKALEYWNLQQEAQREAEREAQRRAPPPDVGRAGGFASGASAFEDTAEMHQ